MRLAFCLGNAEESDSPVVTVVKAAAPMRFERISPPAFRRPRRHRTCTPAVRSAMWPPRPPEIGRLAAIREG